MERNRIQTMAKSDDKNNIFEESKNQPVHAPYKVQNKRKKKVLDKVSSPIEKPLAFLYHKNNVKSTVTG